MNYVKQNFTSGQTLTADQLNHIEDGIATLESEPKTTVQQIQIIHTALKEAAVQLPAAISFIDDDCRVEAYTVLWPVVQAKNIPYAVACPPAQIGKDKFMTKDQLLNMVNGGCEVLSHHYKEDAMTQFESAADYEADAKKSLAAFTELGVNEVDGVVYPNGYRVDEYMPVVRKYFNVGFTIDRGINAPPVETCYMKRCELFPTNGLYTLDDAKKLVDSVAVNGGWLIFMTHAWYTSFSASDLATLIEYITSKHIDIVGITVARNIDRCIKEIDETLIQMQSLDGKIGEREYKFEVIDNDGTKYGKQSELSKNTVKQLAISDGIFLDPVYNAKAFTGMLRYIEETRKYKNVLYINTGGTPNIFINNEVNK